MSTHETRLAWAPGERAFRYEEYARDPAVFLAGTPLERSVREAYASIPPHPTPGDAGKTLVTVEWGV